MSSTTELGDRFRDEVANLLKVAGFTVTTEILLGHKKADIRFEERRFGKTRKYAVEAKAWSEPVNHTDLANIYGGYASLIGTGYIDELIVVTKLPLRSAAAKAFIEQTPRMSHQTLLELQESIMGFSAYLGAMTERYADDGLEHYYVHPFTSDGQLAEKFISEWLDAGAISYLQGDAATNPTSDTGDQIPAPDLRQPLAIVAGYGMGKTSFARYLSYKMALQCLSGDECRIPLLLSLGAITHEQSIEGLIGSTLTGARSHVTNYSFSLFKSLNDLGRFLLIFDGFDEMKHFISYSEFMANFHDINSLCTSNAKIIILGRPSAFLSDGEREYVLKGKKKVGKQTISVPGAPVYREISLAPFTSDQTLDFTEKYLSHQKSPAGTGFSAEFIRRRKMEISHDIDSQLLSRPVHARMLAEIACDPSADIKGISRFQLYNHFIHELSQREVNKPGRRRAYGLEDRRHFACELAWFLWTAPRAALGCRIDELPDRLFERFKTDDFSDLPSIKRELLSGSILEEKSGGVFYIPHRSFQEFLVSEYLWDLGIDRKKLANFAAHITPEVIEFIEDRDDNESVDEFFEQLVEVFAEFPSPASMDIVLSLTRSKKFQNRILSTESEDIQGWKVIIYFSSIIQACDDRDLDWDSERGNRSEDQHERAHASKSHPDFGSIDDVFSYATPRDLAALERGISRRFLDNWHAGATTVLALIYSLTGFPFIGADNWIASYVITLIFSNIDRKIDASGRSMSAEQLVMKTILNECFTLHASSATGFSLRCDIGLIFDTVRRELHGKSSIKEINDGSFRRQRMRDDDYGGDIMPEPASRVTITTLGGLLRPNIRSATAKRARQYFTRRFGLEGA